MRHLPVRCRTGTIRAVNVPTVRLAELLAGLSLAMDLGTGQRPTLAMRSCLLATGLARAVGLAERDVADVYYTTLLQHVGCTAFQHDAAGIFGADDGVFIPAAVRNGLRNGTRTRTTRTCSLTPPAPSSRGPRAPARPRTAARTRAPAAPCP